MQDMRGHGDIIIILLFTHGEGTRPRLFRIRFLARQIDNEILFMRILLNRN